MKVKKILPGAYAFLGMMILILDGKTALQGAQLGLDLCLKAAIPSLFPYFVLSILLTGALSGTRVPFLSSLGNILAIPKGCESLLISAFLGGYPSGAQSVAQLYRDKYLGRQEAHRLLSFCSNAGPAFLFGIVGPMFPQKELVWLLWAIQIISAIGVAALTRQDSPGCSRPPQKNSPSINNAVQDAVRVMAAVCAWIVLFRMVITFLQRWLLWLLPVPAQVAITGILELSNGCLELGKVADIRLRFLLCAGMLSFGGICVTMQTHAVIGVLSLKYYLLGKAMQTAFCLAISLALLYGVWPPIALLGGAFAIRLAKNQNNGGIQQKVGV